MGQKIEKEFDCCDGEEEEEGGGDVEEGASENDELS